MADEKQVSGRNPYISAAIVIGAVGTIAALCLLLIKMWKA